MRKNNLKIFACILGVVMTANAVSPYVHADSDHHLTAAARRGLVAGGIGAMAFVLGVAMVHIFAGEFGGEIESKPRPNNAPAPQKSTPCHHCPSEKSNTPHQVSEKLTSNNLRYWARSRDIMDQSALETALNIYSLQTLGVKYKEFIDSLKSQHVGKTASYSDFYKFVHLNSELCGDKHEYIENICFALQYKELSVYIHDYTETDGETKPFGIIAKVISEVYNVPADTLSDDMKKELEKFSGYKSGTFLIC